VLRYPEQFAYGGLAEIFREHAMLSAVVAHAVAAPGPRWLLTLNTGRVRDQGHAMTRTGRSPRLGQHIPEPFAELHPDDAAVRGIGPADLVAVESPHGQAIVRASPTGRGRAASSCRCFGRASSPPPGGWLR
jgi:assimilatory nitrate reductase catalytic subunit